MIVGGRDLRVASLGGRAGAPDAERHDPSARNLPQDSGSLIDRAYRFSPSYDVVELDDLGPDDLDRLRSLRFGSELDRVLMPRERGLSVKVITRDTAVLLELLRWPSRLPPAARAEFGVDQASLQRLVLDGVLEVEAGDRFVSGPGAAAAMGVTMPRPRPKARPAVLSVEALRFGQTLECRDGPTLAARLYGYNATPVSPRWRRLLASEADVRKYIGLQPSSSTRRLLDGDWTAGVVPEAPGWLIWRLRPSPPAGSPFKLYVSPRCEHLGLALRAVVPILTEMEIPAFKVGRDLPGVLRPDKFVIYAPSLDVLERLRTALVPVLDGLDAQGVPFTAPVDQAGLLSWGVDPPESESVSWSQKTSWRRWLTERLAVALLVARGAGRSTGDPEPWRFALARVDLDGVDTRTWLPTGAAWVPKP